MSTPSPAVSVQQVSKCYSITHQERATTLGEVMMTRLKNPLHRPTREEFWALRDISFDVAPGEVVGIVGRNGAGKSTLLKILSRIVWPTTGQIDLRGRIGSLLEVGTGFHPELTGRENIFLNGAILGMRHREIERQFDEIVDFAGVEQFLDTPVKRYSSGMYVRLAFAVAAHLSSDILIIDEVLAVGDAEFQKKCLGKMKSIADEQGRTILFVSHNMASVQTLCKRCVLLHQGAVAFDGPSKEASDRYLKILQAQAQPEGQAAANPQPLQTGDFQLSLHYNSYKENTFIQRVTLKNQRGEVTNQFPMGEEMTIDVEVESSTLSREELANSSLIVFFKTQDDTLLTRMDTHMKPSRIPAVPTARERFSFHVPHLPFTPGNYKLEVLLHTKDKVRITKLDRVRELVQFQVHPANVFQSGYEISRQDGLFYIDMEWERAPRVG